MEKRFELSKEEWNDFWSMYKPKPKIVNSVLFEDIFEKYLVYDTKLSCIEIGCVPGNFLIYLHKKYGYKIYGVDYSDYIGIAEENMKINCVKKYKIFKEDFLSWRTNLRFDIVCSFGFIEHFTNYKEVIEKHTSLLKRRGLLILTAPNFGYGRVLLHRIFRDYDTLLKHNPEITDLNMLKDVLEKKGLRILLLNYYGTFSYWMLPDAYKGRNVIERIFLFLMGLTERLLENAKINVPNKYFSPTIVCVARAP